MEKHVFIIGSKGIPAKYGGYETFVDKLTEHNNNKNINYYVACKNIKDSIYNNAFCFGVKVPNIGAVQAIFYDVLALRKAIKIIEDKQIKEPIIYILACRIGPFLKHYYKRIKKINGIVYTNPDGHEWKRKKWNVLVRKYWKISERLMIKNSDLIVCDSMKIEEYIKKEYAKYNPKTVYISYGTETNVSDINLDSWFKENKIVKNEYYLVVGRFVPENNYETIIKEFIKSKTNKNLVIVTGKNESFYNKLNKITRFEKDQRIKFVGEIYEKEKLYSIRKNAFAYIHGHEVGGTNPSLLEALAFTRLNLLIDVGFNKEVGKDSCLYWNKDNNCLSSLIERCDELSKEEIDNFSEIARAIIKSEYNWPLIVNKYSNLFIGGYDANN